jgi:DNA-binding NtrC family response regulator
MQVSEMRDVSRDGRNATLKGLLEAYERELIMQALLAADGNQRRAAASLGLLPTTLHEKMKRLGLLRRQRIISMPPLQPSAEPLLQAS